MGADSEVVANPDWDPYRSLVRLIAGGTSIAAERIRAIETTIGDEMPVDVPDGFRADMESVVAMAVGMAAETPDRIAAAIESAERLSRPIVTIGKPFASVFSQSLAGRVVAELSRSAADEAGRLSAVGRREIGRGRQLVEVVYNETVDALLEDLSPRDSLNDLVSDQAFGVGKGAVEEVRETGAAADWLTESMFRRVFRRPPRAIPPKPSEAT